MEISIELSLDGGYLRRACPSCEREFKWHHGPVDDRPEDAVDPPLYHCPYCGLTAEPDQWFTEEQTDYMQGIVASAAPGILQDALKGSKSITFERSNRPGPMPPTPPAEPADMIAVASPCHEWEPFKISETWDGPVHCLVCGARFAV